MIGLLGLSGPALAAEEEITIETLKVRDGVYMLIGQGGNIGLFIGEDGTFLIDDQVRERLTVETVIKAFNMTTPPQPKDALPVVTFATDITFHINGDTLHAFHTPGAHTDGDSVIHFRSANVIHTGDIFFNGFYPFIDVDHGGTLKGMIRGADAVLALADGETKIIPGHGPLGDRAQLQAYREMLAAAYERLSRLKERGAGVEEAVGEKPLATLEELWGKGLFTGDKWVELVYDGLD